MVCVPEAETNPNAAKLTVPIYTQIFVRQMNLQLEIGELVIVGEHTSKQGWCVLVSSVQTQYLRYREHRLPCTSVYLGYVTMKTCNQVCAHANPKFMHHFEFAGVPSWNNEGCQIKDMGQVLEMVNPHPSKAIEDAWVPPSKQVRYAF